METIRINPEDLKEITDRLKCLIADNTLKSYHADAMVEHVTGINQGDAMRVIREINEGLYGIVEQFYLLMEKTHDFLTNANKVFIETDDSLASMVKKTN